MLPQKLGPKVKTIILDNFRLMTRRKFTAKFKTKVVLSALKEQKTLSELGQQYNLGPTQISKWKKEFMTGAESIFRSKQKPGKEEHYGDRETLLKTIGELKVENDFLKKTLS